MKTIYIEKKIRLDKITLVLTPLSLVSIGAFYFIFREPKVAQFMIYYVLLFAGMVISGLYYWPRDIVLTNQVLLVKRFFNCKEIPVNLIKSASICDERDLRKSIRTCGSGGFFGYWGWFYNSKIGKYFAYVGRWNEAFLIELNNGKKYVLSCDDSVEVVEQLKSLIKFRR